MADNLSNRNSDIDQLLEYVYYYVYENYNNIMENDNLANIFNIKTNSMCRNIYSSYPTLTDKEIEASVNKIIQVFEKDLGAEIRKQ